MAAIAIRITNRAGITSSAGTAFVSHTYPAHAHHNTTSSAAPSSIPVHERWSARKPVTWVRAKTKTRSKNSSRGVTRRSGRSSPSVAVRAEPAVLILCPSLPYCQCADQQILTSSDRLLYRTNVQVSQEIYVFSNAQANANFLELRKAEVGRIPLPRTR